MKKTWNPGQPIVLSLFLIGFFVVGPVQSPCLEKSAPPKGALSARHEPVGTPPRTPEDPSPRTSSGPAASPSASLSASLSGSTIDLDGTWLMKDYAQGIGLTKEVNLPGHQPKECLPIQVPGTVRTALLAAGEI